MQRARKSRGALREGVRYDEAAALHKRAEIVAAVRDILSRDLQVTDDATADALVTHLVVITPPEDPIEPNPRPGIVELNLGKLVAALRDGTLMFPGSTVPWGMLLGGLAVWEDQWLAMPFHATETDAAVLWALWKTRDSRDMVSKSAVVTAVNGELSNHGRPALSPAQIESTLVRLRHLKCIETARSAVNSFWLRECVQMQYSSDRQ